MCSTRQPALGRLRPILALSLAAGLALAGCGSTSSGGAATRSPAATGPAAVGSASATGQAHTPVWNTLPAAPLPKLREVNGAWTGKEFLVVGTDDDNAGHAAAYDPATRHWRVLASPPKRQTSQAFPESVWTGTELVVWGGYHREIFNLATNRWREIPDEQVNAPKNSPLAWTGSRVIGFGGGCCGGVESTAGMLDPVTGRWEPLPKGPLTARWTDAVWTGTEVVFAGGEGEAPKNSKSEAPIELQDGAAYDPATRTWRSLPKMPFGGRTELLWDGKRVIADGGDRLATWTPGASSWTSLPRHRNQRAGGSEVLAGDHLVIIGGFTPGTDSISPPLVDGEVIQFAGGSAWTSLPKAKGLGVDLVTVWTGSQVLVYSNGDKPEALTLTL